MIFFFNTSAALSVVPHTFLWEDMQFMKKKKKGEHHWNCNITAAASALT